MCTIWSSNKTTKGKVHSKVQLSTISSNELDFCIYGLLINRKVKMTAYWPSFLCFFTNRDGVEVHKHAKKERVQYPAILTKQACSIKNAVYGIKNTFLLHRKTHGENHI